MNTTPTTTDQVTYTQAAPVADPAFLIPGEIIGYQDMANPWRPVVVLSLHSFAELPHLQVRYYDIRTGKTDMSTIAPTEATRWGGARWYYGQEEGA